MERISKKEEHHPLGYSTMELKDDPALFAEAVGYLRRQLAEASGRIPSEGEQDTKSQHNPEHLLSVSDQGLQMWVCKIARSMIGRRRRGVGEL